MQLPGKEVFFDKDEFIVSKTNLKGHITYANDVFLDIAGYTEAEVIGQPHSMIRHPDMPRCVFKLLWDKVQNGKEVFAYVVNSTKSGDYYWVIAHVTPSWGPNGDIIGYHSTRRRPEAKIVQEKIIPLYTNLNAIENGHKSRKDGLAASFAELVRMIEEQDLEYEEFIAQLMRAA